MDIGRAREHLRAAEAVLGKGPERPAQALLYIGIATAALWSICTEEGLTASRRAMEIAEKLGNQGLWANAATLHGWHVCETGRLTEGLALLERAWEIADPLDHQAAFLAAWFRSARGGQFQGPRDACFWIERELAKPRLAQAHVRRQVLLDMLTTARAGRGQLEEARRTLREAWGDNPLPIHPSAAFLQYLDGDWEGMAARRAEARELARRNGNKIFEIAAIRDLARASHALGQTARAEALYREVLESTLDNGNLPSAASDAAVFYVESGRLEEARRCITLGRSMPARGPSHAPGQSLFVDLAAGVLAGAEGRLGEAEALFASVLDAARTAGALSLEPRILHHWGRALLAANESARAIEKLDAAIDRYRQQGWGTNWVERVLKDKLRAQGVESVDVRTSIDAVAASVERRRPDLRGFAAPDGRVTLMFSDMEGFTQMTERLGDRDAHRVLRAHNAIVREQLRAHRGIELDVQGDGFLLAFADPLAGLDCAVGIEQALATYSTEHPDHPVRVRIGLHIGEAIRDAEGFFGKTVIVAARVAAQARGGEILVSSPLRELAERGGRFRFGETREAELKGLAGTYALHAVAWAE